MFTEDNRRRIHIQEKGARVLGQGIEKVLLAGEIKIDIVRARVIDEEVLVCIVVPHGFGVYHVRTVASPLLPARANPLPD